MLELKARKYYLVLVAFVFLSCQKELDEKAFTNCLIDKIEIFEQAGTTPVETYTYSYNPVTLWPSNIEISIPSVPFNRNLTITVSPDNRDIDMGLTGSMKLDGSRRITELNISNAFPGGDQGEFFYGYNSNGFLEDRLYDDAISGLERIDFENDGSALTGFTIRQGGTDTLATATISYLTTPRLGTDVMLPFTEVFTELLPFFPMIRLGNIGNLPVDKMLIQAPGVGGASLNYQFGNYQLNTDNSVTGFENTLTFLGLPPIKRRFQITYRCD